MVVKAKSLTPKSKPEKPGNYIDSFVKRMFGQVVVFIDFLQTYADKQFVAEIDINNIQPAPTHYIGVWGDERIIDMVFRCPLKSGDGSLMAVIIFEHESKNLNEIPLKLIKYISSIWDAERKEGKKILSTPYFLVLRTGKKPHRGAHPTLANSLPKGSDGKPLGHVPEVKYDVVDLPSWDFGKLIGGTVLRVVLSMLHKRTGGNLDEFPVVLRLLSEITDEKLQIELSKELRDFVDRAFAVHNRRVDEETWAKALHPIFKGKERAMIKTVFEEKIDEGIAIGEGRSEVKWKADMVLKALRKKFGKIPKKIEQAVLAMSDPIALESLLEHVFDCKTLDEFATML
jgi:hypothetical protein